nr:hypothetical protein B0A51_08634 [Rachicladosporium sp. CCFEE 5018]
MRGPYRGSYRDAQPLRRAQHGPGLLDSYRPSATDTRGPPARVGPYGHTPWRAELTPQDVENRRQHALIEEQRRQRWSGVDQPRNDHYANESRPLSESHIHPERLANRRQPTNGKLPMDLQSRPGPPPAQSNGRPAVIPGPANTSIIVNPEDYGFPAGYGNRPDYIMVLLPRTPALRYDEDPHAAGRHAAEAVARVHEHHAHQRAINPPVTDPEALQRAADLESMQAAKSLSMAAAYRRMMDETMPVRVSTQASHEVTAADFPDLRSRASPAQPVGSPENRAPSASVQVSPTLVPAPATITIVNHAAAVKVEPVADDVIIIEDDPIAAVKMEPVEKDFIVVEDDPLEPPADDPAPPSNLATRFQRYVPKPHLPSISKKRAHVADDISLIKRESPRPQAVLELRAATDELPVSQPPPSYIHAEVDSGSRKRLRVAEDTLTIKRESPSSHVVLQVHVAIEGIGMSDQDELPGSVQTSQPHGTSEPQAELNVSTGTDQREDFEQYEPFDDVITTEQHELPKLLKELEQFRRSEDFTASQRQASLEHQEQSEQLQHEGRPVENASPEQHTTAEKRQHCAGPKVLMPTQEAKEYDAPGGLQENTHEEPTIPVPPPKQAEAAVQQRPRERSVEAPAGLIATEDVNLDMIGISHLSVHVTDEHCTNEDAKVRLYETRFKTLAKNEDTGSYLGLAMWCCLISYWVITVDSQGMAHPTPVTLSEAVMMPKQMVECHQD